ncbi:uncharacterized protein [Eucyclogobius newberryi]|uniref:uncharacterized protein n=1 Tax=Eucyclogobius newberryi TaxID=166745 RepID=UPI003B5C0362
MKPRSSFLFSLLSLLLLPRPSLFYSFKNCSCYDLSKIYCNSDKLNNVPSEIPKSATSLSVYGNHIQSIRGTDFTGFYKLDTLNLGYNEIAHIDEGAFSDLNALTSLSLVSNRLTLLMDDMFKGLYNLSTLRLDKNKITSISKLAFESLNKLNTLSLSSNYLAQTTDITNIYLHCPSLEELYLEYNNFTSFQSHHLSSPALKTLSLKGNNLTVFEPKNAPFNFSRLTDLNLGSNPLRKFSVHSDVFPLLNSLSLDSVSCSVFEWDVADKYFLRSLTSLELYFTSFTIETYRSLFQTVDSVHSLDLFGFSWLFDKGLLDFACSIPSLQMLILRGNNISVLNDSLLQSCNNLTHLMLSNNSLTDLTEASIRMLTRLILLQLEENRLSKVPAAIRNLTTLQYLYLDSNQIKELQCSDLIHFSLLTELSVYDNSISNLNSCVFKTLTNLKCLNIGHNNLLQLDDVFDGTLHKLERLDVSKNYLGWIHKDTFRNMTSLTRLSLESTRVISIEGGAFRGLNNLKEMHLTTDRLGADKFNGLSQLRVLSIVLNCLIISSPSALSEPLFSLPLLQHLEVKVSGDICFTTSREVFKGLDNLRILKLTNFFFNAPKQGTFLYTPRLELLRIEQCFEFDPAPELFHPLTELKTLHLPQTGIKSLNFLSEANLTKLEKLNVVNNELKVINETVFKALPSLKYLQLSGNPFVCNCSNAGFIDWAIRNKQVQVVSAFQFTCSSPPSEEGHFLMDFNVQLCWEATGFLCFMSSSALVLLTLLSSFIYHFLRWQLVYGFYLLQAFLYDSKKRRQGCPYIYDAFVSYNVHNEDWVYGELMPELEERQGWRLCLHHRDFQPGKAIIENITDAIYSSRKTLCVISRRYLQSEWCSREIQMASFRLFDEQKDVLILLFLEEIPSNHLSPFYRMRKLVKSRTYLSWTQAQSHKGLFWEKVRRALECGHEPGDDHNPLTANI